MSHALYRFYDDTGTLLYVGITSNPQRRFGEHGKDKNWWRGVRGISIDWYDSRAAVEAAERRAVRVEQPVHNKALRRPNVTVLPSPVTAPQPWERSDLTAFERDAAESFECAWTAHWWDDPAAKDRSGSPYQHDGRRYAWRPANWVEHIVGLLGQEVPHELRQEALVLAYKRNGPDGVWRDFFNMCALEDVR